MGMMDSTMEKTLSSQATNWREGRRLRAFELKKRGWKQTEIADALGITRDAVYKRVEHNKIRHEKDADGELYVYVEMSETGQRQHVQSESSALRSALEARIESLERQQEFLKRQLEQANERDRENRRLLAAALERIPPQLEAPTGDAPSEARESPVPNSEGSTPTPEEPRTWWRR
jgi:predicted transcriptional regulator